MSATPDKMPATPGKILIADDEESIRWVLERACAKDGHTVHAVASGREALAALRERAYDVALIDIKMPDLSGLDALTRARAAPDRPLSTCLTGHIQEPPATEAAPGPPTACPTHSTNPG